MRIARFFSHKASVVFPGYTRHLASPLNLQQDFQEGVCMAYRMLLHRLAAYEFDLLKDVTELSFWRLLKNRVSVMVDDGFELSLVGSSEEPEVNLVKETTHTGAVLPFRNLLPCALKFDVTEVSPCHFMYKYKPSLPPLSNFSLLNLQDLKKLNAKADLSEYEPELDNLYSLLNKFPQVIHRRTVEINTSLKLQSLDSQGKPVGSSPEMQLHRLTFEMLEKPKTSDAEAAAWFAENLDEESESWVLVDVDEYMQTSIFET